MYLAAWSPDWRPVMDERTRLERRRRHPQLAVLTPFPCFPVGCPTSRELGSIRWHHELIRPILSANGPEQCMVASYGSGQPEEESRQLSERHALATAAVVQPKHDLVALRLRLGPEQLVAYL